MKQKIKRTISDFPELVVQWCWEKNGKLKPEDFSYGCNKKVWWKCSFSGHEWEARINHRTSGSGCPCCRKKAIPLNCLFATHSNIAKEWHPTKNGNLTPQHVTAGSNKIVWWKCSIASDHEWKTTTNKRTACGRGCPYCCGQKICDSNCLLTTHPNIVKEWHPTKNGNLTPQCVTAGSNKKVWWRCDKQHEWQSTISKKTSGRGCPFCNESKGEKIIRNYLLVNNIKYKTQYRFLKSNINKQRFDLACKHGVIEFQGIQHYKPTSFGSEQPFADQKNLIGNIYRDHKKVEFCKKYKIPLLIIPYWDFNNIEKILDDFFAGKIPTFSIPPEIVTKNTLKRRKIRDRLGIKEPELLCGLTN